MVCAMTEPAKQHRGAGPLAGRSEPGSVLTWFVFVVALLMYLVLAPQTAGHMDKDWTHLWLGGRMVAVGCAAELYDPERQVAVYRQADPQGSPPPVWEDRNRMFGCFNYPPPAALAYSLVAWLPVGTAAVVQAYASIALALTVAWLLAAALGRPRRGAAFALAVLAYPAFFINLSLGQNAVFTMAVVLIAWCLCERRRDLAAGLVLGLLVCKPNWLFAVAWIPLVHARWRVLAGMTVGVTAVVAATALILGVEPFRDYAEVFRKVASLQDMPGYYLDVKYSALGLFRKWLGVGRTADLFGWASCLAVVLVTWRVTRGCWKPGTVAFRRAMACCLAACLWVNPHLNYYDLLLTAPCAAVALLDWPRLGKRARLAALAVVLLAYAAVPWDEAWNWRRIIPVPSFASVVLWGWFAYHLPGARRTSLAGIADVQPQPERTPSMVVGSQVGA